MNFQVIASSSGGCCYILRSGNLPPLLLDAGVRFKEIQKALDFKLSEVAGCLLTHAHGDHSKAAKDLIFSSIPVYASSGCWKEILSSWDICAKHVKPDVIEGVDGWQVLPFSAVHDSPGTLGFLIADDCGNRALYLTDSAYSLHRFENLTHIYIECNFSRELMHKNTAEGSVHADRMKRTTENHMCLETLLELLKANDLSRVQEIHLLHLSDQNSDEKEFAEAVRRATGKPVYIAAKKAVSA